MRAWFSFLAAALPDPAILCNSARSSGASVTRYFFAIVGLLAQRKPNTLIIRRVTDH
jgi:hypothetical protein